MNRMNSWSIKERVFFAVFFLMVLIASVHWGYGFNGMARLVNRLYVYHGYPKTLFYILTYLGSVLGLVLLYLSRHWVVRIFAYLSTFICMTVWLAYLQINSSGFGYNEAVIALSNLNMSGEALGAYFVNILNGMMVSLLLVVATAALVRVLMPRVKSGFVVISFLMVLPVYAINARTLGDIAGFPALYQVPVITAVACLDRPPFGPRMQPSMSPVSKPMFRHIVLIVDESVRGDMLNINGYKPSTTPYLKNMSDEICNWGIASSATNCSSTTHLVLEDAIGLNQLPDNEYVSLRQASLFQLAQKAGCKTIIIDGQNWSGEPPRYSSKYDYRFVDKFICVGKLYPTEPAFNIDNKIVDQLGVLLAESEPSFIYVIKYGCHFMYDHDYPSSAEIFSPTISNQQSPTLEGIMNSYHNAIRWSVDGFFRGLMPIVNARDVIVLYTSDHGQSIEDYRTIPATHCVGKGAPCSQARVPMFLVFSRNIDSNIKERLHKAALDNYAKSSHYNLVPTLLYFMGYDLSEIHRKQGLTLLDKLDGHREFVTGGIYGRGFFEKRKFQD